MRNTVTFKVPVEMTVDMDEGTVEIGGPLLLEARPSFLPSASIGAVEAQRVLEANYDEINKQVRST